ncbi:GNAT family N-acetyltransferase [Occultella glacieicola]|uniref:GNAT family N-acetyltransferase n=2 Tax=Occultella glacieicola TaxID=2518684 RepID=A0ABY2E2I0_9MICO|nr:GNAT family N-acetyltransferase [Occultella glacieicola]
MTDGDVPQVIAVQEPGTIVILETVFPQDAFPFPRDDIARRWRAEIDAPEIDAFVVVDRAEVIGFAAIRHEEFLHFGIAIERWGSGAAQRAHAQVLEQMRHHGVTRAWLRVFTGNSRARAFYERLGWRSTGDRTYSTFAPNPELLRYERDVDAAAERKV